MWQVDQKYSNLSEEIQAFNQDKPSIFNRKKKEGAEITRRINLFKEWFKWFLAMNTVVLPEGYEIPAREFYVQMTLKMEAIPPYRPLHPKFLSIASLYSNEELSDLFGSIFANRVQMITKGR